MSVEPAAPPSPEADESTETTKSKEPAKSKNGKSVGRGSKAMEAKPDDAAGEPPSPR